MKKEGLKIKKAARTVIFDDQKRAAILSVRNGEYYKIPGGAVEANEDERQAAEREAWEEAGVKIELLDKIGEHEFIDPDTKIQHYSVCFLAKKIGEQKVPNFDSWEKNNEYKLNWLDWETAIKMFEQAKPVDFMGREINKRDLDFLRKAKEAFDKKEKIR